MIYFRDIPFGSNEAVKYTKELEASLDKKDEEIKTLKEQILKMPTCGNCRKENAVDLCDYGDCLFNNYKHWELKNGN